MTRTALITGSAGGIGQAVALRFAQKGFNIAIHIHREKAAAWLRKLRSFAGKPERLLSA